MLSFISKCIKLKFIFFHQVPKFLNIKGASLAPHEIRIDLAVFLSLYFLYCLTAKCVGSFFSNASNSLSIGFMYVSSSSLLPKRLSYQEALQSSFLLLELHKNITYQSRIVELSAFTQNLLLLFTLSFVFAMIVCTNLSISFSLR